MYFIKDLTVMRLSVTIFLSTVFLGVSSAAALQKPSTCNKQDMLFKPRHIYTYDYTVHISSAFLGASPSMSASKLSCTLTLHVPRRCEHVLQLSACSLSERNQGADDTYTAVQDADQFLQDLQRYSTYFQMDKGIVIADSILAENDDTLQVLNVKRGIISALQFPVLEEEEYKNPANMTDIFGRCLVEYDVLDEVSDDTHITSERNLRHCDLPNIYTKQINVIPAPSVGQMVGGVIEEPITEMIYPFEMTASCLHTWNSDQTLGEVECLQRQYYTPLAYQGDYLVTAMSNISQKLELKNAVKKKTSKPDLSLDGRSVINIKFDFGADFNRESTLEEIRDSLAILTQQFEDSGDSEGYETVPGKFGDLMQLFRSATQDTLEDLMMEVFDGADDGEDKTKVTSQVFFLDSLESCGTEPCIKVFLHCMLNDHTTTVQTATFLQGLKNIPHASEDVLEKLHEYCESSGETLCWLSLGTILSRSRPEEYKEGTVLHQVHNLIHTTVENNCNSGTLVNTERELSTMVKTARNIANYALRAEKLGSPGNAQILKTCLQNRVIPTSVKISLLQNAEEGFAEMNYKNIPAVVVQDLFSILKDDTTDSTVKAFTFSLLMKTTNKETIQEVVDFMMQTANTDQMKSYMTYAVRNLFENDAPDMAEVRASWEVAKEEKYFSPKFYFLDSVPQYLSKSIGTGSFYKLPVTEIFGGQIEADIIFDPSSSIFSTVKTALNFYYGNEKYKLVEFMVRVKGFDLLKDVILKRIDMTPMELFELYKNLKARAQGQGHDEKKFAKFQQNIVKAVEDILKEVNHPVELDFDLSVDISVKGKAVMFGSLQELMAIIRQMYFKLPPNTSLLQVYLKKLMAGISKTVFKSKEIVGLVRDLPTCAGLPLNLTVHVYGTHKLENSLQSNLLMYMAKKSPTLSVSGTPGMTLSYEVNGELAVQIGTSHSSGMKAKILVGAHRDMSLKLTYGYSDPMVLVENPTKKKLEFEMKSIYNKDDETYFQKIFYARGRMQLNHYSGIETVSSDPTVSSAYRRCNYEQWISMLTRKKMCLDFVYPDVKTSKTHAYFPLSGPFDLDITIEDLDGYKVDVYKLVLEYERQKVPGACYTDHFNVAHIRLDETMSETKLAYWNMVYVRENYSLTIEAALPDFHYTYTANFTNTWRSGFFNVTIAELLKRYDWAYSGHIFKVFFKRDGDLRLFEYHWNVTRPTIGFDIQLLTSSSGRSHKKFGDRSIDFSMSYHCSQERPLLYMFHMMPTWAAENFDTSKIHIKSSITPSEVDENKETVIGMIEFYGRKVAWEVLLEYDGPTIRAHQILTYAVGGVEKTATADYSRTWGQSEAGMTLDITGDIQAENFNVIVTGSGSASKTDVTASGDIQYHNSEEENTLSRKKRYSVYEKLKAVEEAAINKAVQIKNKIFGASETDGVIGRDRRGSDGSKFLALLQDTEFPEFSIWDLEDWNTKLSLTAKLNPIFADGVEPGTAPPEALEAAGIFTAEYPWNGGYVHHNETFSVGKFTHNTMRNFRMWLSGNMDTTYTNLDGTPIMDGDKPLTVTRRGLVQALRKTGKIFDFVFSYNGPDFKKNYSILFDWDASTHHEPLYHVRSEQTSELMPFLNHFFDEKLFYEPAHFIHKMEFSHEILKMSMDTEFNPRKDYFHENGSISIKILEKMWAFDFENTIKDSILQCSISPGSMPGKTFVYTLLSVDSRNCQISGALTKEPGADPLPLWSTHVSLLGTSKLEVRQMWTPAYQEQIENYFSQGMVKSAMMLQAAGEQLRANMDKPLAEQTIIFTHLTPGDLIKQAVMPNFVGGMKFWGRFLGNIVPSQYRPTSPDVPGPVIAPRFAYLMRAMKNPVPSEPNPMIRNLQFLEFIAVKVTGKLLLSFGTSEFRNKKIEEIFKEGQYTYMISTAPFTFRRFFGFPKPTQFYELIFDQVQEMFGFARNYYRYRKLPESAKSVAVIFGRHDSDRVLSVQTFDNQFFDLTARKTEECSYLLASDLRQQRWSLVLSPAGVTLLTSTKSVTVGWDKNVYLDNCRLPKAEISDDTVTVERVADTIHVLTPYGLNLEFNTAYDNCLVTVEGPYRNETIGLLGTNDGEKLTDFRLKSGHLTTGSNDFMAEYLVAGTHTCRELTTDSTKDQELEADVCEAVEEACDKLFQKHYVPLYKCQYNNFGYNRYCENEGRRCKDGVNSCHALKAYIDACEQKGQLKEPVQMQGCEFETPVIESSVAGSLDIVFVVSQHVSMTKEGDQPKDYMYELTTFSAFEQFKEVRLGVVLFGGSDPAPHTVRLEDNYNCLFTDRDDYDWDGLFEVSKQTAGGTDDTDGFLALQEAASLPFNPVASKMIILLMTKEQSSGKAADISAIKTILEEQEITLNVFSTYSKTASARVIGITSDGQVITKKPGYKGNKSLPKNDYAELITATNGALWDLNVISGGNIVKMRRMSEEFVKQTQPSDQL